MREPTGHELRAGIARKEWLTKECPACLRQSDDEVEVKETDEEAEIAARNTGSGSV